MSSLRLRLLSTCFAVTATAFAASSAVAETTHLPDGSVVSSTVVTSVATAYGVNRVFTGDVVINKDGKESGVDWAVYDAADQTVHASAARGLYCRAGVMTWGVTSQGVHLQGNPYYPPDQPRYRAWCAPDRPGQTDIGHFNTVAVGLIRN